MTNYFIKSGGDGLSATTDPGVSGDWSGAYAIFADAVAAASSGDQLIASDAHLETHTTNHVIGLTDGLSIMSVSDADTTIYSPGAKAQTTGGNYDLTVMAVNTSNSSAVSQGIDYSAQDDLYLCDADNQRLTLSDCTVSLTGGSSSDIIQITKTNDGCVVIFNNVNVSFAQINQAINLANGSFKWTQGTLTSNIDYLFEIAGNNGGYATIKSVDLSNITVSVSKLLALVSSDNSEIMVQKCLLSSGVVLDDSATPAALNASIIGRSIGIGTGSDDYHYFNERYYSGDISEDTSAYRNSSATYDGTNSFSVEISGNSNTSRVSYLKFELAKLFIDVADYSTDITFKVHFALEGTTTPLNNDDFWVEIEYADGANNALGALVNTRPAPRAASAAHTTETGIWTIGATNVQMSDSVTINIGSLAGDIATGAVSINVYLAADVAPNLLFVDPGVEIS